MDLDALIIGGGPAGMSAAIYLLRAGKSVEIIEKENYGGQIANSPRLENFPSIKAIDGSEFASNLYDQVEALGAKLEYGEAQKIEKIDGGFKVTTEYGAIEAKGVIIASGCHHRKLGNPREDELVGRGISYCATCDGPFFAGEDVVVIGDANTALQYAVSLSNICHKVTIMTLFDHFFADDILVKKIKGIANIEYAHNWNTETFNGAEELESITFKNTQTGESKTIPCKGAFICVGQVPCNEPFAEFVDLEKGFIVTNEAMETKTPGIYAAGDCRKKGIRQVITATSDGAIAALSLIRYLDK